MKLTDHLWRVLLTLACIGLLVPNVCLGEVPAAANPAPRFIDVSLQDSGVLQGQLVDPGGIPRPDVVVTVSWKNQPVAQTKTDGEGEFKLNGLRGGVHSISTPEGAVACRMWVANTAPPNVDSHLLVVTPQTVVRGNGCCNNGCCNSGGCNDGCCNNGCATSGGSCNPCGRPIRKRHVVANLLSNPYLLGVVVATAVIVPVAINAADDDSGS